MHFADERAGPAPDHAVANLSVESHWGCVVRDSWCVISLLSRAILRGSASSAASNVATRQQGFQPTGDFFPRCGPCSAVARGTGRSAPSQPPAGPGFLFYALRANYFIVIEVN
jgi:hypothetical protein